MRSYSIREYNRRKKGARTRLGLALGAILRSARHARGMTLREVGDQVGIRESSMSRFETGYQIPGVPNLIALAEFYNLDLGAFGSLKAMGND